MSTGRPVRPAVIHTTPRSTGTPNDLRHLVAQAVGVPRQVTIIAEPGMTCSDLGDSALDMIGRPGTSAVTRKALPRDLMHLLPFLVVDDVRDLVIIDADELDRLTIEQLLMVTALAGTRLALVPAGRWAADIAQVVQNVAPVSPIEPLVATWQRRRGHRRTGLCLGQDPRRLGDPCPAHYDVRKCLRRHLAEHLQLGRISPNAARKLLQRLSGNPRLEATVRQDIIATHGRVTVVPAVGALRGAGLTPAQQVAVRLDNVARAGHQVLGHKLAHVAPVRRQVLHSRVLGLRSHDHFLTLDGTPMRADTVARL